MLGTGRNKPPRARRDDSPSPLGVSVTDDIKSAVQARSFGMTESMICRLERGDHVPSVETLLRVAEATGNVLTVAFTPGRA